MFWVNLGISDNFGQEKPRVEEDPKGWYDPKKKGFGELNGKVGMLLTRIDRSHFDFTELVLHQF